MSKLKGTINLNSSSRWNMMRHHVFGKTTFVPHPHAILGCDKQVIAIRNYPRDTTSNNVVPIPDGEPVKVGWVYKQGKFLPPEPTHET